MKSKKNLAATLAFLMTMQASGQPWAVLANEGEVDTPEPIIGESDTGTAAAETAPDPVIEEGETEAPQATEEIPTEQEAPVDENQAPAAEPEEEAPAETEVKEAEEKLPAFNDMSDAGTYTARVETINGDYDIKDVTVDLGTVAEKAPNMEAGYYYFRKATVNGQEITAVRSWKMEKDPEAKTYYQLKEGNGEPVELKDGERVVLVYEYVEPKKEETAEQPLKKTPIKTAEVEAVPAETTSTYHEVKFFDGERLLTTQWIKDGETAVQPATDDRTGYAFSGWKDEDGNLVTDFTVDGNKAYYASYISLTDTVRLTIRYVYAESNVTASQPWTATVAKGSTISEIVTPTIEGCTPDKESVTFENVESDQEVTVTYSGVETQYKINHYKLDSDGNRRGAAFETETLKAGANTFVVAEAKTDVPGYTAKPVSPQMVNRDGSTVINIEYVPNNYRITYLTDGGSYVAPKSVYVDEAITDPETPKKLGYDFVGWTYVDEQGNSVDGTMPASNVIATANWNEKTDAEYKVAYWLESLEKDENGKPVYVLAQTDNVSDVLSGSGTVGDVINPKIEKSYTGFTYDASLPENQEQVTITADGKAVKNIYFTRNTYTIQFAWQKNTSSGWFPSYKWVVDESKTITAKYGENISAQWDAIAETNRLRSSTESNKYYSGWTNMPAQNITIHCIESRNMTSQVRFYTEGLDGEYHLHQISKVEPFGSLTKEDLQTINGFEFKEWKEKHDSQTGVGIEDKGQKYTGAYLLYSRNSYALHFENCRNVKDASVKYEDNYAKFLPSGISATTNAPESVESDYVFEGWYKSPAFAPEDKVTAESIEKMPTQVVTLYANWVKPKYTVTYNTNGGTTINPETLEKDSIINLPKETPVKEGDEFLGWYTDANFKHQFVEGTQIGSDITLFAKWKSDDTVTYTVQCVDENGDILREDKKTATRGEMVSVTAPEIEDYYPVETGVTVTVSEDGQIVTIAYSSMDTWSYTVSYLDEEGNKVAEPKEVTGVKDTMVLETYQAIDGFQLVPGSAPTISLDKEHNKAVFTYCHKTASYTVKHFFQNTAGDYVVDESLTEILNGKIGNYVTADPIEKTGYRVVTNGYDLGTVIRKSGSEINIYYDLVSSNVRYVLDSQPEGFDGTVPETSVFKYGETVKVADLLNVPGYTFVGWTTDNVQVKNGEFVMPETEVVFHGSFKRNLDEITVTGIDKDYNAEPSAIEVNGLRQGDEVTYYDEDGQQIAVNEFEDVAESGKVYVVVHNPLADKDGVKLLTSVKINRVPLTVSAKSETVFYDGGIHKIDSGDVTVGQNQLKGEDTVESSMTSVEAIDCQEGGYEVVLNRDDITVKRDNVDKTNNYIITTKNGCLVIKPRTVTISTGDAQRKYDGTALINDSYSVSEFNEATGEGFAGDEGVTVKVTGSQTIPGTSPNTFEYAAKDGTKLSNYTITEAPGTLKVSKLEDGQKLQLTLEPNSNSVFYNGTEQSISGFKTLEFTVNDAQFTIEDVMASASGTDVGEYNVKVSGVPTVKDSEGKDVTENFDVQIGTGQLVINKRAVTISTANATKPYDGTPLTNDSYSITEFNAETGEGFVEGEGAAVTVTGSRTLAGSSDNTFKYELKDGTNADNYTINTEPGELTVTKLEGEQRLKLNVVPNSSTVFYNGEEQSVDGFETLFFEIEGVKFTVEGLTASAKGTNAGKYDVKVGGTAVVKDSENNDVTENFDVQIGTGQLVINKRAVTISTEDATKPYDGTPLTNGSYNITEFNAETGKGFVEGEGAAVTITGSQTMVGDSENTFEYVLNDKTDANNYTINKEPGALRVTKADGQITIDSSKGFELTAEGYVKKYDGVTETISASAYSKDEVKIEAAGLVYTVKDLITGQETITAEAPTFTNAGKWEITVSVASENVEAEPVTVCVTITKRNVLIKSEDQEWVYDGNAHSHEVAVHYGHEGYDEFVEGEEPETHSFASITNAGQTDNTFSIRFNKRNGANVLSRMARIFGIASEDPDHIADNYNIEVQYGTLKVNKAAAENHGLAANVQDKTVTYNGQAQTLDPAVSNVKDALIEYSTDGKTWSTELPAYTHAGKYEILVRASHDNYEDAQATAVLTIVPAKLTVTTESAEKEYDGKPLTAPGTVTGLAEGDEVELTITGSQTEVGSSTNTYELKWTGADAADYEVEEVLGTLTVKEAPKKETPKNDDTPKKDTKTPSKVATALGLDPALWTSIMGAAGLGLVSAAKLSRKDRKKKDED